jgi:hypothetical protein
MSFRRALFLACAITLAVVGPAGAARKPQALYKALLTTKVTASQLPHGYKQPVVGVYLVTAAAKTHHAVGGVRIFADGGNEGIIYIVFASAADARADWSNANFKSVATAAAPKSIPKPSIVVNTSTSGTVNGKTLKIGISDIAALRGNVIVQALTTSRSSATHGDVAGAVALAQFALQHLAAVS